MVIIRRECPTALCRQRSFGELTERSDASRSSWLLVEASCSNEGGISCSDVPVRSNRTLHDQTDAQSQHWQTQSTGPIGCDDRIRDTAHDRSQQLIGSALLCPIQQRHTKHRRPPVVPNHCSDGPNREPACHHCEADSRHASCDESVPSSAARAVSSSGSCSGLTNMRTDFPISSLRSDIPSPVGASDCRT